MLTRCKHKWTELHKEKAKETVMNMNREKCGVDEYYVILYGCDCGKFEKIKMQ